VEAISVELMQAVQAAQKAKAQVKELEDELARCKDCAADELGGEAFVARCQALNTHSCEQSRLEYELCGEECASEMLCASDQGKWAE